MIDNNLGLKDFWKTYKGCGIRYKIGHLFRELKYAFQRAWRGYDDSEAWSIDESFRVRMIHILSDYKNNFNSLFRVPRKSDHYDNLGHDTVAGRFFTEKEAKIIVEMMIFHLNMMNENYVENHIFGDCIYNDHYRVKSTDDYLLIHDIMFQNKECFMKLFNLFFYELWD